MENYFTVSLTHTICDVDFMLSPLYSAQSPVSDGLVDGRACRSVAGATAMALCSLRLYRCFRMDPGFY